MASYWANELRLVAGYKVQDIQERQDMRFIPNDEAPQLWRR